MSKNKPNSFPELGKVEHTARGFEIIEFRDAYNEECSLQQSSLAGDAKPGATAIWLGCENAKNHHVTNEPLSPRMHLTRDQVEALIPVLQSWLDTGSFRYSPPRKDCAP